MGPDKAHVLERFNTLTTGRDVVVLYEKAWTPDDDDAPANSGTGTIGNIAQEKAIALAGILLGYRQSVWIDAEEFDPVPEPNRFIKADGVAYQILNTEMDAVGSVLRLDLGDENE